MLLICWLSKLFYTIWTIISKGNNNISHVLIQSRNKVCWYLDRRWNSSAENSSLQLYFEWNLAIFGNSFEFVGGAAVIEDIWLTLHALHDNKDKIRSCYLLKHVSAYKVHTRWQNRLNAIMSFCHYVICKAKQLFCVDYIKAKRFVKGARLYAREHDKSLRLWKQSVVPHSALCLVWHRESILLSNGE